MFPIPKFSIHPQKNLSGKVSRCLEPSTHRFTHTRYSTDVPGLPANTHVMSSKLHISVRPPQPPVHGEPSEQEEQFLKACTSSGALSLPQESTVAIAHAKEESHALQSIERPSRPGDDVAVVPLGTCSAAPSKHRNGTLFPRNLCISSPKHLLTRDSSIFDVDTNTALGKCSTRLRRGYMGAVGAIFRRRPGVFNRSVAGPA